ncbi:MAG: VWA domain-containing protein [Treponema sp.]|jgi:Ca-activated chloride channel family protein|nr:VWA domain-containing protein [Treponema sp.]
MSFTFDRPLAAAAAFIIIILSRIIISRMNNPFIVMIPLGAPGGVPFKAPQMHGLVKFLKVLEFTGVFLLFISASGPVIKTPETVWLNRGADIIFIVDTSPSMAALDMDGKSRFDTAKALLTEFCEKRPTDSIGLVAAGSDAVLLVPPTPDRTVLKTRMEQLRLGEFGDGTALGMGLAVAAYHLEKSKAKRKVTVLITDGENNAGAVHPETAASMLREMGVSLWVIGAGSAGEVPIDYTDPYTKIRRTGLFDSRFDTEALRRLSAAGGGTYIFAPSAGAFASAFSRLDDSEIIIRRSRVIYRRKSIYLPFLLTAFGLLIPVKFIRRVILGALL